MHVSLAPLSPIKHALLLNTHPATHTSARRRLATLCLVVLVSACGVNNIPSYDESANAAWGEVQRHYQQRADLVAELIASIETLAPEEEELASALAEARQMVINLVITPHTISDEKGFTAFENAQNQLSETLLRVTALADAQPVLATDLHFATLQERLQDVTNLITASRGDYIEAVRRYNTELRTIPGRWWHSFIYKEMQARQLFSIDEIDVFD